MAARIQRSLGAIHYNRLLNVTSILKISTMVILLKECNFCWNTVISSFSGVGDDVRVYLLQLVTAIVEEESVIGTRLILQQDSTIFGCAEGNSHHYVYISGDKVHGSVDN